MPPISIFLRIQCSPLEILGFHGKFFCCHLLSNVLPILLFVVIICYFFRRLKSQRTALYSLAPTIGSLLLRRTAAVAATALRLQFTPSAPPLLRRTAAAPHAATAAIAICNCCIRPLAAQPK
jgi:hypothetical protein